MPEALGTVYTPHQRVRLLSSANAPVELTRQVGTAMSVMKQQAGRAALRIRGGGVYQRGPTVAESPATPAVHVNFQGRPRLRTFGRAVREDWVRPRYILKIERQDGFALWLFYVRNAGAIHSIAPLLTSTCGVF